jgi:hypothetical protein
VSPILLFAIHSFGTTSQDAQLAQEILVNFRIPHHTVISDWLDITTLIQLFLVTVSLWLVRKSRLFPVLAISILLALILTTLQVLTGNNTLALVFPWRISVVLVPLSTVNILAYLVQIITRRKTQFLEKNSKSIFIACGLVVTLLILAGGLRFVIEFAEKDQVKEHTMYQFVKDTWREEDVYLLPTKMQDFRLETGAPIYVDFKSIPYLADEVLEWYRRILLATELYDEEEITCEKLDEFHQEGVTQVVLESHQKQPRCNNLPEIYQDSYYRIYQFNTP